MADFPVSAKLLGEDATNPALPNDNVRGTLSVKNGSLIFKGDGVRHAIPLEHIDKCVAYEVEEPFGNTGRMLACLGLPCLAVALGIHILASDLWDALWAVVFVYLPPFYFLFFNTAIDCQIVITAWDEEYGMDATTIFSLGHARRKREAARELVKEIWRLRGTDRSVRNSGSRPVYRVS